MDRKPKTTQEGSLVETNLPVGKSIRLLAFLGRWTLVCLGNWNLSLNLMKVSSLKEHSSLRAWNDRGEAETEIREDEGTETTVSVSTLPIPALEDRLASKSLDLTLEPIFSLLKTPRTNSNQSKD